MHGDLAARNVLVGRQGFCKLTGIGEHPLVFDKDTYATRKKVYQCIQNIIILLCNKPGETRSNGISPSKRVCQQFVVPG